MHGNRLVHVSPILVNKLADFIHHGPEYVQVICDFDHTLSKYTHNAERVPVCHGLFIKNSRIPEVCRLRLKELSDFYSPFETSPDMYAYEKSCLMKEFWNLAHKALVDGNVSREDIDCCVMEGGIVLRNNVNVFVNKLNQLSIPIIIFSGGIGNVIETGRLVGFQDPIIHCCNKTYDVLRNTEYFETTLSKRMCILLIGDSASDANMVDDRQTFSCEEVVVIRIGFLNEENDEKLKLFSSLYDLILLSDETFDVPLFILSSIFNIDENDEKLKLFSSLYDLILLSDETFDVPLFILSSIFNIDEVCNHEKKKKNFTNSNI
ncbi:7-methylguanosine phosphate-specific 5'-nucleotidase [Schistosoma japonicum]|uniref:5'-nucleotidase n=1 Tax=Schistosoma japonicum TaxID=6182 RepID=A0A4Z2D9H9_SCHJA|nr:7-methylguanosine phosphate-specific 5'-nucleotidase [Schistosoma japonicum]